jgi:acetyltransferase-like isoleucine patch superfamily enzyme
VNSKHSVKSRLSAILSALLRGTASAREGWRRLYAHASLAAELDVPLPASTVLLGSVAVYGTGHIHFGEDILLYPGLHFETQGQARIDLGDGVVISRGTHIVAMAGVSVGAGSMIGEYSSIRDANHNRDEGRSIRDSGYAAKPIHIGREVWIGRGVTVLGGVTIGDKATIGANAVVTRDVAAGSTVVGIPAAPIARRGAAASLPQKAITPVSMELD